MQTIKPQLSAAAGIVSRQRRLEACTVGGGPGTVLKYMYVCVYIYIYIYIYTHTHVRVFVCVCERERDLQVHALYFRLGVKCFIPHLYKMHCTP